MAQPLDVTQAKYSNYSKLAAGKFRDLFGGQFFFDLVTTSVVVTQAGRCTALCAVQHGLPVF